VFKGQLFHLDFRVSANGIFGDLAAVAFLPPRHSPSPLLNLWNYEAAPPITLRENNCHWIVTFFCVTCQILLTK